MDTLRTFASSFPSLASELSHGLRADGRPALADQIDAALIAGVTFDDEVGAACIYLLPSRELSVVETNIIGVRHGETVQVDTRYFTIVDTDNFGRLTRIEILTPGDLKDELREHASG